MWGSPATLLALTIALHAPQAHGGFPKIDVKGIGHAVHDAGKALPAVVDAVKGSKPERAAADVLSAAPKLVAGGVVQAAEQGAAAAGQAAAAGSDAAQDGTAEVLHGAQALQTALGRHGGVRGIGKTISRTVGDEKKVEEIVTAAQRVDADKLLEAADSVNWLQHNWQTLAAAAGGLFVALLVACWALMRCVGRHRRNREAVSAMIDAEISMYLNPGGGADARVFTRF